MSPHKAKLRELTTEQLHELYNKYKEDRMRFDIISPYISDSNIFERFLRNNIRYQKRIDTILNELERRVKKLNKVKS
jgi:hypothetical protein